jgi:hypothetical protein
VRIDVVPPVDEALLESVEPLLRDALAPPAATHTSHGSAWRRAAARESVRNEPRAPLYALSPRSTRGATRA